MILNSEPQTQIPTSFAYRQWAAEIAALAKSVRSLEQLSDEMGLPVQPQPAWHGAPVPKAIAAGRTRAVFNCCRHRWHEHRKKRDLQSPGRQRRQPFTSKCHPNPSSGLHCAAAVRRPNGTGGPVSRFSALSLDQPERSIEPQATIICCSFATIPPGNNRRDCCCSIRPTSTVL